MTGLQIGLIAPPWVPVPPDVYGGTESVIDALARGLDRLGHHVVLWTTGDSTCPVSRRWALPSAVGTTGSALDELRHVEPAFPALRRCDLIHDHTVLGPLWAVANQLSTPLVTTMHGNMTPELADLYQAVSRRVAVVAISDHQRRSAPQVPVTAVIRHGVDLGRFPLGAGDGGYLLFLGRMHPDKGVHRAIRIARASGRRLLIAAKMWEPAEHRYYHEQVEPLLGPSAVYLGTVGGERKLRLLAGAVALVNPIRWPEPFGLVMIEALAAGTPVLVFDEGAAREIVVHGRTGFICTDEADMVRHLHEIDRIDRGECRRSVEARFTADRMVRDHVELYERVLGGEPAAAVGLSGPDPAGVHR